MHDITQGKKIFWYKILGSFIFIEKNMQNLVCNKILELIFNKFPKNHESNEPHFRHFQIPQKKKNRNNKNNIIPTPPAAATLV